MAKILFACPPPYKLKKIPIQTGFVWWLPIVSRKYRWMYQFCYVKMCSTKQHENLVMLDDPGRVRSHITSVVCQIQRFDFDCNLYAKINNTHINTPPATLRLKPLYRRARRWGCTYRAMKNAIFVETAYPLGASRLRYRRKRNIQIPVFIWFVYSNNSICGCTGNKCLKSTSDLGVPEKIVLLPIPANYILKKKWKKNWGPVSAYGKVGGMVWMQTKVLASFVGKLYLWKYSIKRKTYIH
jgi:hypothetical protein